MTVEEGGLQFAEEDLLLDLLSGIGDVFVGQGMQKVEEGFLDNGGVLPGAADQAGTGGLSSCSGLGLRSAATARPGIGS